MVFNIILWWKKVILLSFRGRSNDVYVYFVEFNYNWKFYMGLIFIFDLLKYEIENNWVFVCRSNINYGIYNEFLC